MGVYKVKMYISIVLSDCAVSLFSVYVEASLLDVVVGEFPSTFLPYLPEGAPVTGSIKVAVTYS